jgi:hypothetical protein
MSEKLDFDKIVMENQMLRKSVGGMRNSFNFSTIQNDQGRIRARNCSQPNIVENPYEEE